MNNLWAPQMNNLCHPGQKAGNLTAYRSGVYEPITCLLLLLLISGYFMHHIQKGLGVFLNHCLHGATLGALVPGGAPAACAGLRVAVGAPGTLQPRGGRGSGGLHVSCWPQHGRH